MSRIDQCEAALRIQERVVLDVSRHKGIGVLANRFADKVGSRTAADSYSFDQRSAPPYETEMRRTKLAADMSQECILRQRTGKCSDCAGPLVWIRV